MWIVLIILLVLSILGVLKAADIFVNNLSDLGTFFGVSDVVLGVTASAIGTSLPEFGSAMIAILTGNPDVGVGTVIGANMWNIGGILGITALVTGPILSQKVTIKRDGLMALGTAVILLAFLVIFHEINIIAGLVLLTAYGIYTYFLIEGQKKENRQQEPEKKKTHKPSLNIAKTVLYALLGVIGLAVGCHIIVYCAVELSAIFCIPAMFAGIILAFGTTSPEFFTVITSARKGLDNLALGTVLGSNIFNIMIGLGVPAILATVPVDQFVITYDGPALILITILLLLLLYRGNKLSRKEGLILIGSYVLYISLRTFMHL
ncbi:MAG: calcium/sodium antiporter [Methanobacterium sp.]|jgi:cation:H+ antiporter|nr:calcium/sodium antiporter [Methanobacterium sp.]HHT18247.1 calcium/sodium antiporter [Methanobacterium sp.]